MRALVQDETETTAPLARHARRAPAGLSQRRHPAPRARHVEALALGALVRDLARATHVVSVTLRREANAAGAEDVLAWQTGYPAAVSFATGHPRSNPGELSAAAVLERGDADAALVVGSDPLDHLPPAAAERLRAIPVVTVDATDTATAGAARVAFTTAAAGVHRPGVVHRLDGVPVPLRAPLASERPSDEEVLAAIAERLARRGRPRHDAPHHRRPRLRPRQRRGRRRARRLPARRQGRRRRLDEHATRIDARGMVVMPGGVDIHAHIAGPKVNAARRLAPDEHRGDVYDRTAILRSGTGGTVPSTFVTGYRYALLGYTTVVEAATPPLAARHVLSELRDTPMIDALFLLLMGNNVALFDLIRRDPARVRDAVAWSLRRPAATASSSSTRAASSAGRTATATSRRWTTTSPASRRGR